MYKRAKKVRLPDAVAVLNGAGRMPPIFGVNGKAYMSFLTDRFTVRDILGKTIVLRDSPDDFTARPSGNAGAKSPAASSAMSDDNTENSRGLLHDCFLYLCRFLWMENTDIVKHFFVYHLQKRASTVGGQVNKMGDGRDGFALF